MGDPRLCGGNRVDHAGPGVTFEFSGSLSGTGVWANGLRFNSATELNVQARATGLPNNFAT
ncbi:MAG: hypothetical protein AAFQ35_04140 [Pseudomonadota bacterium]